MHRIDSRSAHNGTFRAGNPIDGTPPTALTPEWFNSTQEEIVNVIAAANIPLDKTDNSQLLKALRWLIAKAIQDAGTTTPVTPTDPTNHPPTTPTITTDLPATITRGNSYDVKFASTDPDNDAVTFTLSNLVGCNAAKTTGIDSTGVSITIGAQADSVSFAVVAVDSKGAASAAATVSRSGSAIVNPTGSTGWLTAGQTHTVSVPDWADTVTFTGHGAQGSSEEVYNAYAGPYLASDGSIQYAGGYSTQYTTGANTTIKTGSTTLATFTGSSTSSTPSNTTQIKALSTSAGRTLTIVIPVGGALKADWS